MSAGLGGAVEDRGDLDVDGGDPGLPMQNRFSKLAHNRGGGDRDRCVQISPDVDAEGRPQRVGTLWCGYYNLDALVYILDPLHDVADSRARSPTGGKVERERPIGGSDV